MLTIRQAQMEVLRTTSEEAFLEMLYEHAWELWREDVQGVSPDALRKRVTRSMQSARALGIQSRYDLTRYLDLGFILEDEDFGQGQTESWAREILSQHEVDPEFRLDEIYRRLETAEEPTSSQS